MSKKTLNELTLKDNFMFGAVMTNEENCRKFLNLVLNFPISKFYLSGKTGQRNGGTLYAFGIIIAG